MDCNLKVLADHHINLALAFSICNSFVGNESNFGLIMRTCWEARPTMKGWCDASC